MKWTRKNSRHHYGPHWITDRKTFEKGGAILALLDYSLKWRAAWIDKLDRMHWQWFPTRSSAKEWIEQMARSKSAKQEEPEPEEAAAQSADQLAAIAGRKAAEALDAYAAALDHAAAVALDNCEARDATARRMAATQARDFANAARKAAARLA